MQLNHKFVGDQTLQEVLEELLRNLIRAGLLSITDDVTEADSTFTNSDEDWSTGLGNTRDVPLHDL